MAAQGQQPPQQQRFDVSIFDTPFKSLPDPKRVWVGEPGSKEESLGRLNLLTPDVVAAAAREEIQSGQRVGLGWDMTKLQYSQFGRQKCRHEVIPIMGPGGIGSCFDDAYSMNPRRCFLFFFLTCRFYWDISRTSVFSCFTCPCMQCAYHHLGFDQRRL